MGNGSRALAIRWHQTEKEKEELKRDREAIRQKQKDTLMRHANRHNNSNGEYNLLSKLSGERHVRGFGFLVHKICPRNIMLLLSQSPNLN